MKLSKIDLTQKIIALEKVEFDLHKELRELEELLNTIEKDDESFGLATLTGGLATTFGCLDSVIKGLKDLERGTEG